MNLRQSMLVIIMLCLGTFATAQEITGTIVGTVRDKSGAVVPKATVVVTNTDTKEAIRTLTASDKGEYSASLLPIGHYSVSAEAPNFKKAVISNITLHQNERLTFDPTMEVGATDQTVNVQAEALQVETQSATASGTVTGTQIRELALNGRNYEQLLTLVPGVSDAGNSDQIYVGALAPQGTSTTAFSINGGRREQSNFMVDGADNVDRGSNLTLLAFPSADAISEFKVYRGQYDPELGRSGSGQVNVITRSGTSQLHGNIYEFARNDAFNANTFFNKRAQLLAGTTNRPPILRYNNFGGTIGGPVWIPKIYEQNNKTFFFFSEEQRKNIVYTPRHAEVPTAGMLAGNFRVPVCVAFDVTNKCTATSTSIAPAAFPAVTNAYLQDVISHYPATNVGNPATDPFGLDTTLRGIFNFREEIIKIDHRFSDRFSVSGKFLHDDIPTREPGALFTNIFLDNIGSTSTNSPGHNYTLRGTIAWSPTLLIEPGYGYSYGGIISRPDPAGNRLATTSATHVVTALGNTLPFATTLGRVPNLTFSGFAANAQTSAQSFGPYDDFNINHSFFTNVTKTWRAHTFKFGAVYYHYRKNENNASGNEGTFAFGSNGIPTNGALSASGNPTPCVAPAGVAIGNPGNTCPFAYEQAFANFLLGRPGTFSQSFVDLTADIRDNQFEYYAQDAWRVKSNLTLSYGIRHSFYRQPTDALGLLGQFDPAAYDPAKAPCIKSDGTNDVTKNIATGAFTSACNPNYDPLNGYIYASPPAGFASHKSPYGDKVGREFNWAVAPRLGVAWDPWKDGKTSVRAGWGMFYDSATIFGNLENDIFLGTGFQNAFSVTNNAALTFANPTAGTTVPANGIAQAIGQGRSLMDPNYVPSYTSQWSLDIQHDLGGGMILDVGYYGNSAIHLPGFIDMNQPGFDAYVACTAATPCKGGPPGVANPNSVNFDQAVPGLGTIPVVNSTTTNRLNAIRPYVGYAGIQATRNIYTANYNGLQTQLQKKFSSNTMVNVAYTWSHASTSYIADRSTGSIMPVQGHIRDNNWGPSIGDRRHVLTTNFVWDAPWYQAQKGLVGHILGGWEVSGVQTFQTGLPATATYNSLIDPSGSGCLSPSPCSLRANQVGDPNSGAPHDYFNGWFNNSAFVNPVAGDRNIPTERPGALRLPGFWRTDMGLFKNIKFTERVNTQLRLETYNTFNHTNPVCCTSTVVGAGTFGLISSTRDPRTLQIGAKIGF